MGWSSRDTYYIHDDVVDYEFIWTSGQESTKVFRRESSNVNTKFAFKFYFVQAEGERIPFFRLFFIMAKLCGPVAFIEGLYFSEIISFKAFCRQYAWSKSRHAQWILFHNVFAESITEYNSFWGWWIVLTIYSYLEWKNKK